MFLQEPSEDAINSAILSKSLKPRPPPKFRLRQYKSNVPDPASQLQIQFDNAIQNKYLQDLPITEIQLKSSISNKQHPLVPNQTPFDSFSLQQQADSQIYLQNFLRQYYQSTRIQNCSEKQLSVKFTDFGVTNDYISQFYQKNADEQEIKLNQKELTLIPTKLIIDLDKLTKKHKYELDRINQPGFRRRYGNTTFIGHLPNIQTMANIKNYK
eukprot:EST44952.1 Hypothetical protein SS50377_14970 [Spironucleus salmonicida]